MASIVIATTSRFVAPSHPRRSAAPTDRRLLVLVGWADPNLDRAAVSRRLSLLVAHDRYRKLVMDAAATPPRSGQAARSRSARAFHSDLDARHSSSVRRRFQYPVAES